jgi:hypothetical protein
MDGPDVSREVNARPELLGARLATEMFDMLFFGVVCPWISQPMREKTFTDVSLLRSKKVLGQLSHRKTSLVDMIAPSVGRLISRSSLTSAAPL